MTLFVDIQGDGPDLVLLHGWAMHSGVFNDLLPALKQHYRVHCIDLPGHGRSAFGASMGELSALAEVVKPLVPPNSHVLGWSLGGLLALRLAQRLPLRSLIAVSTTPRFVAAADWSQGMAQPVFSQFFAKLQTHLHTTVQDFLALQTRGDSDAAATLSTLQQLLLAHPGDEQALQLGLQILRDADERATLPSINLPTLVMAGEYDRIVHPRASEYLASQLPQARFELIRRAGHAPFLSHPRDFLTSVLGFLAEPSR